VSGSDGVKGFETLDVQVKALEGDVRDIKTSITNLAAEVRSALGSVSSQFAQTQKTPWVSIGSMGAILIAVLGFVGNQALFPITTDIKNIKDQLVPRVEHDYRQSVYNKFFDATESRLIRLEKTQIDDLQKTIENLRLELLKQGK
jgi:hypothetical protein